MAAAAGHAEAAAAAAAAAVTAASAAVICCLRAGMSGPISFDKHGDLIPHKDTYITVTYDPEGGIQFGKSIPLP